MKGLIVSFFFSLSLICSISANPKSFKKKSIVLLRRIANALDSFEQESTQMRNLLAHNNTSYADFLRTAYSDNRQSLADRKICYHLLDPGDMRS